MVLCGRQSFPSLNVSHAKQLPLRTPMFAQQCLMMGSRVKPVAGNDNVPYIVKSVKPVVKLCNVTYNLTMFLPCV